MNQTTERLIARIVIPGIPRTKKNSPRVVGRGKSHKVLPSEAYCNYEDDCLKWFMTYRGPRFPRGTAVNMQALYYMRDRKSRPDLVGLIQATQDILEKARVLANDQDVVSLNGSKIAGYDKDNPRVEIELWEVSQ